MIEVFPSQRKPQIFAEDGKCYYIYRNGVELWIKVSDIQAGDLGCARCPPDEYGNDISQLIPILKILHH